MADKEVRWCAEATLYRQNLEWVRKRYETSRIESHAADQPQTVCVSVQSGTSREKIVTELKAQAAAICNRMWKPHASFKCVGSFVNENTVKEEAAQSTPEKGANTDQQNSTQIYIAQFCAQGLPIRGLEAGTYQALCE